MSTSSESFGTCIMDLFMDFLKNLRIKVKSPDALVSTDCGIIRGSPVGKAGFEFRGIPYAEPPIGKLRWQSPVAVEPGRKNCWKGTFNAGAFGSACIQENSVASVTGKKYIGSEDCLYLNVWTPTLNSAARLPVLFWIHGGSLQVGNGNLLIAGQSTPAAVAKETGMVVVSVNYRLHAFGFMALEMLRNVSSTNSSGNYGFMDMIEGMHWVQRNIQRFGGDPNKVTIMGQSSGGTAVFALLASPLCHGLFSRAIMMSASPILNKTATEAFRDNMGFVRNTNCSNAQCLYNLTTEDVMASIPWDEYPYWHMADQLGLPPKGRFDGAIAIVDGYVLTEAPFHAWVHGVGVDVPVLVGTTAQETNMLSDPLAASNWTWASGDYERYVRQMLGQFSDVIAETALKLYSAQTYPPEFQYASMTTDIRMTCGNDYLSLVAAKSFTSPVYRYVTTQFPTTPFTNISTTNPAKYAFHGTDVLSFFADSTLLGAEYKSLIRTEVTSFVKSGRPSSSEWRPYPEKTAILSNVTNVKTAYHGIECLFWLKNGFFAYSWIN